MGGCKTGYMTTEEAKSRIAELTEQIEKHNHNYYVLSKPTVSDYDFDMLLEELIRLEKEFPQFLSSDSPSQRVGGTVTKEFKTVKHKYPMLSLSNSYSREEVQEFENRIRKLIERDVEYVCELKYDGVAIGLTYKNGKLEQAVTRGDGIQGDDVTTNIKTIKSIPLKLQGSDFPAEFEIRGEVFLPLKSFEKMNKEREEAGEELYANPRNTASGTLKMQDSAIVAKRNLDCFLYFILGEELPFKNHFDNLNKAREWGFNVPLYMRKVKDIDGIFSFIDEWDEKRHTLPFETDGVVIKVNSYDDRDALGFTAKNPRWAIAYKFKTEQAATLLNEVTFQVGRTGAITPVANLQPVLLAGTTVKRASLYNADQIEKLDLHGGDTVLVEKGGEIIPKIVGVDLSKRAANSERIKYITNCPECGAELIRKEGESVHYCPNETECPPQIKGKMEHFVSRKAMDIDSLGAETIDMLFQKGLVRTIADIYDLKKEDIVTLERMAEKSAANLIEGIEKSKAIPFTRVLFALGIRFVGETVAKKLALHFKTIDALMNATFEQLLEADEIGDKIAASIKEFFANEKNVDIIKRLREKELQFELSEAENTKVSDKLAGKTFVVSGVFAKFTRDELEKAIEDNGGKNVGSISKKTTYIVAGENMGPSKLEKAQKLNVPIITEDDFIKMLATN